MSPKLSRKKVPATLVELEAQLTGVYGCIVGGARLTTALGYPSQAAFRQAVARGKLPVPVFEIDGRRGKFARIHDIAVWVHKGVHRRVEPPTTRSKSQGGVP